MALNELKRKQQLQDLEAQLLLKQRIAQQDPLAQLLQRGKIAQSIQSIAGVGGDVSQFRGILGGGQPVAPQAGVGGVVQPTPQVAAPPGTQGQFRVKTFEPLPLGGFKRTFERVPERKGLSGESAAKLTMINQALSDLEGVEKQLFTPEGKFKRGLAFSANIPGGQAFGIGRIIPDVGFGTEARILNSRMNNALEAKLRIETGAAATQEEFNRLQTRFGVTGFDTPESARNKIRRLKEFMRNAIITIDPTGRFIYKSKDAQVDRDLNVNIPQLQSLGLDPNKFEIVGEE